MSNDRIRQTAKAAHMIGLALFLGSILGHAIMSVVPGSGSEAKTTLILRQAIEAATVYLTLPGLVLVVASGLVLTLRGKFGFGRLRWLTLHQLLALAIVVNAVFVLLPAGDALLAAAASWAGGGTEADFQALAPREAIAGAINILLAVAAVFVASIRPRLRRRA
ncbi:MAG: hypothetical protein OEQ29_22060 [Alphaproteobacteria bacterium]|nr:hypothetical protein [Alphaproteobacteria bacterium]